MNSITTLGLPTNNTLRNVKIESKKISAQCTPYFFSTIKTSNKSSTKINTMSVKNK